MDTNQPNNNSQNTSTQGINNAGNPDPMSNVPPVPNQTQAPQPVPTPEPMTQVPEPKMEGEISTAPKPESNGNSYAGLGATNNFANKTIVGGVDEDESNSKSLFSLSRNQDKQDQQNPAPENSQPVAPSYNEVTAGGAKSKFALIAIAVGVVLLLLAGGGYYYYTVYMNNVTPTETVTEVVEEPIVEPEPVVNASIDDDQYIIRIDQMEQVIFTDPSQIESQLETLEFSDIDTELTSTGDSLQMEDATMEETIPMQEDFPQQPTEIPAL